MNHQNCSVPVPGLTPELLIELDKRFPVRLPTGATHEAVVADAFFNQGEREVVNFLIQNYCTHNKLVPQRSHSLVFSKSPEDAGPGGGPSATGGTGSSNFVDPRS